MNYSKATFIKSAHTLKQLPEASTAEVAFAGRSNAGKSSALNTITNNKSLARISKTPGRTQLLNFFKVEGSNYLVDLPGYGYAKVPEKMQQHWQRELSAYVETREQLRGLILIMDVRHPLKDFDKMMINWATSCDLPIHILLTKADKLARGAAGNTLLQVKKELAEYRELVSVQLFSALKHSGVDEARAKLDQWFANAPHPN